MAKRKVSSLIFEYLVNHLVNIEENREQVAQEYHQDLSRDKRVFLDAIREYIDGLDRCLARLQADITADNDCPFVVAGSVISLEDVTTKTVSRIQIIPPFADAYGDNGEVDCATFLSPLSQALLLKKVGDRVVVETPQSVRQYLVKSISLFKSKAAYFQ